MKFLLFHGVQGRLITGYGLIMLVPLLLAVIDADNSLGAFALSSLLTILIGLILLSKNRRRGFNQIGVREGYAVVAGIWLLTIVLGALPYFFSGYIPSYVDALFESTSGLTATGSTILADIESLPRSLLLWRSLTQWLGGIGIIVLFIVLLPKVGMGAVHMIKAEITGPENQRLSPKIRDTALLLGGIYTAFTVMEIILLKLAGLSFFDALNHGLTGMATGGFSTKNASIGAYNSLAVELILITFMVLSGVNFALYVNTWRKGTINLIRNTELKVYLSVIALATIVITGILVLQRHYELGLALRQAAFQVAATVTTTGFAIADYNTWPSLAKMIIFFLMFVGGCAASTSGGIKMARLILLYKTGLDQIKQAIHPQLVTQIFSGGQAVDPQIIKNVSRFFFLFMLIFTCAAAILAACGLEPFDAMGAAIAALGNVGPGFGVVGPAATFAEVAPLGKVVLIFCMLLGRLELMTFLVIIRPEFWRVKKNW